MTACRFGAALLLAISLAASVAMAAERELVLEVILNGRSTGEVGEFTERDGTLYARPSDLRSLGFALAPATTADDPIPLSTLPGIHARIDKARQTLLVTAGDAALRPTEIGGGPSTRLAPLTPSGFGAVLNYDILGTFTGQQDTGSSLFDARAFSSYGLLQSTGVANVTPYAGQKSFVRLDTTYTFSQPDEMRRWRVGDVVTGALPWSRAVRLGGVQVTRDFSLRPDLITYPLPQISGSAAVPSTVNVMVNGIRQYSQPVQPGPFAVQTLPVVTGAGEVAVATQDALGRQVLVTLPFYASTALLKPGLASYSVELGSVRQNYGLPGDMYSGEAMNGSLRYGVSNWLTLETHGEASESLALLGAGAAVQVGTIGVVNMAVSGSSGRGGILPGQAGGPGSGGLASLGFQRLSRNFNFSVTGTVASAGYRDLAAVNGTPVPSRTLNASIGYQLGDWGGFGLAYISQRSSAASFLVANSSILDGQNAELVTASYNVPIAKRFAFYATAFKDMQRGSNYGVGFGISFSLGASGSASTGGSAGKGLPGFSSSVSKTALSQGDFGYRVQDAEGQPPQRQVQGEYLSRWGRVTAGLSQSPGLLAGRAGATGALALAGGSLLASDEINDSFAVVRTGGVPDVPVTYENRLVGTTNSHGELLVPSLLSYQNNKLAVDATQLPPDIEVGQTSTLVRPPDRSGVVVDFHVRAVKSALVKLRDRTGHPIPLGSVARLAGEADVPVGYDGEAYVIGLAATNRLAVALPDGTRCIAQFAYTPVKGDIPVIGPLLCQ